MNGPATAKAWPTARSLFGWGALKLAAALIVGAVAVGALGALGTNASLDCAEPATIVTLQLAGTAARANPVLANCTKGDVTSALWWDTLAFIPAYGVVLIGTVVIAGRWRAFRITSLARARSLMVGLAAGVIVLDLTENLMLALGLRTSGTTLTMRNWAAAGASTFAWPKFVFAVVVAAYLVVAVMAWIAHVPVRSGAPATAVADDSGKGISLSGGGVRAGTVGLGFLQALDGAGLYSQTRWLSAVSGGSYMAGAWATARSAPADPAMPLDAPKAWATGSPEVDHMRANLGYLFNRAGGAVGAMATLLVGLAVNLAVIFTMLWLVARPLGWLVGSDVVAPALAAASEAEDEAVRIGASLWGPVARWSIVAALLALLWVLAQRIASLRWGVVTTERFRNGLGGAALAAVGVAVMMALVLIAIPATVSGLPRWIADHQAALRTGQIVSGGGVAATVFGVLRHPLRRWMPRLGGVLVLALLVVVGAEIAAGAARNGWETDRTTYLVVLAVFALVYYVADPDWWSLQPYYRARLRSVYATHRTNGMVTPYSPGDEPDLGELTATPSLVVCTTLNARGGTSRPGVPAYSLTFSPVGIEVHVPGGRDGDSTTYHVDTARYAKVFRRWDTPRLTAMTAVGMSGAAVSSAMGRFNYGSTAALLALANVRLGMWMPNPRYVADPAIALPDRPGYPRRRISYLFKEMARVHDPDDLYVYVTDGGHWENLGVVELIRRGCTEIFCLDSSGSQTDSFGTLADAITLAAQECGAAVDLSFEPLRAKQHNGRLSRTVDRDCAVGIIRYASGRVGLFWYAKASLTADVDSRLMAYKESNDIFPCDPTTDQLFDTEKFECYRVLGTELGRHVLAMRDKLPQLLAAYDPASLGPKPCDVSDPITGAERDALVAVLQPGVIDMRDSATAVGVTELTAS